MEVVMALLCWKCIPPRGTPYAIQADASDEIIWATGPEEKAKDNGEKTDNQANGAAEVWEKQDHPPPPFKWSQHAGGNDHEQGASVGGAVHMHIAVQRPSTSTAFPLSYVLLSLSFAFALRSGAPVAEIYSLLRTECVIRIPIPR